MNAVELDGVSFQYGSLPVLEDVSLHVPKGEFLAILGPNGSGKSTLLKIITGSLVPTQGRVTLLGKSPRLRTGKSQRLGYVPQITSNNAGFPLTAGAVVMMGLYQKIGLGRFAQASHKKQVHQAMARVGVEDLNDRPLSELSGGQRQRVFLARAMVNQPEILLLDEPTTGIDSGSMEDFYTLLKKLHADGVTILIVSHDVGVVAGFVDRVACLNRSLVAHGKPESVLEDKVMQEMYGCDAVLFSHGHHPHMVVRNHNDD